MISAKITQGHTISAYYSIGDVNSGATYSREPCVVSKNIVSSLIRNMAIWMKTAVSMANLSESKKL